MAAMWVQLIAPTLVPQKILNNGDSAISLGMRVRR